MKTSIQIKAEHPDWTDKQVFDEFSRIMDKDARSIGRKLRKIQEILETDPISANDDAFQFWAEIYRDSANLIDPPLGGMMDSLGDDDEDNEWAELDRAMVKPTKRTKKRE